MANNYRHGLPKMQNLQGIVGKIWSLVVYSIESFLLFPFVFCVLSSKAFHSARVNIVASTNLASFPGRFRLARKRPGHHC